MTSRISRAILAFVAIFGLLTTSYVSPDAWAVPTPVPSYPSAAEVAAAKKKVSTKKAMIKRIEALIAAGGMRLEDREAVAIFLVRLAGDVALAILPPMAFIPTQSPRARSLQPLAPMFWRWRQRLRAD